MYIYVRINRTLADGRQNASAIDLHALDKQRLFMNVNSIVDNEIECADEDNIKDFTIMIYKHKNAVVPDLMVITMDKERDIYVDTGDGTTKATGYQDQFLSAWI